MRTKFEVGESFLTNQALDFDELGDEVAEGTLFEIVEIREEEIPYGYHVWFNGYGSEDNSVRMGAELIEEIRKSAMCEN